MKQQIETFDDWLKSEQQYEDTISAWDMDDTKKLKEEHALNCDSKANYLDHLKQHHYSSNNNMRAYLNIKDMPKYIIISYIVVILFAIFMLINFVFNAINIIINY